MRLHVGLAAGGVAAQADLDGWQRRAAAAQDALQCWRRCLLHTKGVVLLYNVGQFVVLLQAWLLRIRVVALRAAGQRGVLGPGLADADPAEVVLAGQLDGVGEDVQADGADELLFETVPPRLSHVRGHHGVGRHALNALPTPAARHRSSHSGKSEVERERER